MEPRDRPAVALDGPLLTVDGRQTGLKDFEERVLILNFWATWCGPCLAEMPSLERLQSRFAGQGLRIIAVTDEDSGMVQSFLQDAPYGLTVLIDRDGSLARRLRIWSIPWTLVLDSRRRLVHFHQGARLWDTPDMVHNLEALLRE